MEWKPTAWACSEVREKNPALDPEPDPLAAERRASLAFSASAASWTSLAAARALEASSPSERDIGGVRGRRRRAKALAAAARGGGFGGGGRRGAAQA
jgi:hypothetical protein